MNIPANLRYTQSHEWVKKISETVAVIGLTEYAQSELGDLVFVNLPEVGDELLVGETFADVESVKAVSDVYSPVCGRVSAVNEALLDDPAAINNDCYEAWLIEADSILDTEELLSAQEYEELIGKEG